MTDEPMSLAGQKAGLAAELGLRRYTPARVALGRAGQAIPTREQLAFQLDHALARDAVHARMDVAELLRGLRQRGMECIALHSAVPGGSGRQASGQETRRSYLRRPDLGRRLDEASREALRACRAEEPDAVIVIADGLSALAVERHALPLLDALMPALESWRVGPVCVVSQGRVAIGDEIGERLGARLVMMLIGERPGLSAADSLGVYITWAPRVGRTDAERNCVSNIRWEGLSYAEAARRIAFYSNEARRLEITGVALKERDAALGVG